MELVSVIIPTFNSKKFIGEAIDSIFAQRYSAVEFVIIDDGSTDDTVAVARQKLQTGAAKFQIIELGANKGPSFARNVGIRAANGSWVQFLDSDDILMPRKIERQMAICEKAAPDVAAIYSPWNWGFLESGEIEWLGPPVEPFISGKAPIMCLAAKCRPLLGACLIRRSALEKTGGFDEALRFWECEDACVKLALVGRFVPASSGEAEYLWRLDKNAPYVGASGARYNLHAVALGWIKLALRESNNQTVDSLGLSDQDKQLLKLECTTWGRMMCAHDRAGFREYLRIVRIFDPHITPSDPTYIKVLARWVGYERAEIALTLIQRPKVWIRTVLNHFGLRRRRYTMMEVR
jgi:glycosyltransferase involved in cell wall biosynthesis